MKMWVAGLLGVVLGALSVGGSVLMRAAPSAPVSRGAQAILAPRPCPETVSEAKVREQYQHDLAELVGVLAAEEKYDSQMRALFLSPLEFPDDLPIGFDEDSVKEHLSAVLPEGVEMKSVNCEEFPCVVTFSVPGLYTKHQEFAQNLMHDAGVDHRLAPLFTADHVTMAVVPAGLEFEPSGQVRRITARVEAAHYDELEEIGIDHRIP